jgi:antitoxin (DNA-binding transcriptional repressor) of toxin-antitoxin stability system
MAEEPPMLTVDIDEAEKHLSRLVDEAANGQPFVIAIARKLMVKVIPLDVGPEKPTRRTGFIKGQFSIPDDFDTMFHDEIIRMFEGEPDE